MADLMKGLIACRAGIEKGMYFLLLFLIVSFFLTDFPLFENRQNIFRFELVFVLLHTLVSVPPYKKSDKTGFLLFISVLWTILVAIEYISLYSAEYDFQQYINDFLRSLFHVVFAVYALDILLNTRIKLPDLRIWKITPGLTNEKILLFLLYIIVFSIALIGTQNTFLTAERVLRLELLFVFLYLLLLRSLPDLKSIYKEYLPVCILMTIFLLITGISFFLSPYDLVNKLAAIMRYIQVMVHLLFFVFVYEFLRKTGFRHHLLLMIPLSVVVILIVFLFSWGSESTHISSNWFLNPPLADHIRHIGYIVTAASVVCFAYLLTTGNGALRNTVFYSLLLLFSSGLLFWTGGRAATASVLVAFVILVLYLFRMHELKRRSIFVACFVIFISALVSYYLEVFAWNGLLSQWHRTSGASDLVVLTSNRTLIWQSVLHEMDNNWILGLGMQGYFFMPGRIYGFHPHNLFLQFLFEWGIVGASIFLGLLLLLVIKIIQSAWSNKQTWSVELLSSVSVFIVLSLHALFDGTYYHAQPSFYLALSIAICLSQFSRLKS